MLSAESMIIESGRSSTRLKYPTGNQGPDAITLGALPRSHLTLVCGNVGCRKTAEELLKSDRARVLQIDLVPHGHS